MESSGPLSVPVKEPEREAGTAAGATEMAVHGLPTRKEATREIKRAITALWITPESLMGGSWPAVDSHGSSVHPQTRLRMRGVNLHIP